MNDVVKHLAKSEQFSPSRVTLNKYFSEQIFGVFEQILLQRDAKLTLNIEKVDEKIIQNFII